MEVNFGGVEYLSLVDYPGRSCITIFLRGCDRRCPWCFNKELQTGETYVDIQHIYNLIDNAKPFISAACISGGECLLQLDAVIAISKYARQAGLYVGVHTSHRELLVPELLEHFDMVLISDPRRDPR